MINIHKKNEMLAKGVHLFFAINKIMIIPCVDY
jgi:hypothetical protein